MARPRVYVATLLIAVLGVWGPSLGRGATPAERLAGGVPEETLAFVATSGVDELEPAFEKTALSQFFSDPNVRPVIDKGVALIEKEINNSNDPTAKALLGFVKTACRRPILAGISSTKDESKPSLYGFIFIDAGPQKEQIESALRKVENSDGQDSFVDMKVNDLTIRGPKDRNGPPAYWGWVDRILVIGLNDTQRLAIRAVSTRRSTALPVALGGLPSRGDALVIHADLKRLHGLMMSMAKKENDPELLRVVNTLSTDLALSDLQALAVRMGFQDKGIASDGRLQTANPKGPLLGLIKPADLSMLDAADVNAISASVWNLDLAGLYDLVMRTAKAVAPPEDYADFEKGLAEVEARLGFKIRQDLLAGLSGPMSAFAVEVPNSMPPTGSILTVKLRQPEAVDKALAALAKVIVDESHGSIQVGTTVQDGCTLRCIGGTTLALVQLMPTWVVVKDRLILATNTALCTQALQRFTSGGSVKTPLRTTASYRQVCGRLPEGLLLLKYTDTPRQFRQVLQGIRPFWPLATAAVSQIGIQLPLILPTFDRIVDQLPPSGSYCWQEKDGLRWHSEGSNMDATAIAGAAVGAGVMMPALARARTQGKRAVSMNNLKQIGLACIMYADDNKGTLPPSLQSVVDKGYMPAKVLQSPGKPSPENKPFYIYISGQTTKMDPQNIVAYEDPEQAVEGVNAVFMDGHVEFIRHEAFQKRLEETHKRLGREMPK